ncbi:hypothetical protein MIB92_09325 [Aestuariirhabdus sp. Z084]|uniref:hypothetical protein n=1 Tax=Aestuariirhabdus haliotis TaxID=2918751 RepID=UPI00201B3F52|nr:hypothetical protein [Aestuariirhabdus haliotis]MCL6415853.1 hypothetical protein [Aestuariirhabdus haliotis]MCL6419845.1 hypothetical protein [Aestuariirhabdus haliotis]
MPLIAEGQSLSLEQLSGLLPHQGDMCLLASVESWDQKNIHCRVISHRSGQNPLRHCGRLDAHTAVEYAGQAMAVHGSLLQLVANSESTDHFTPPAGYLVGVNHFVAHCQDLSKVEEDIDLYCEQLIADSNGQVYQFEMRAQDVIKASGRVTVMLDSGQASPLT